MVEEQHSPCFQTDKMITKLQSILTENGGIGCSRTSATANKVKKYTSAGIYRLHEELRCKMKNSLRTLRRDQESKTSLYTDSPAMSYRRNLGVSNNSAS